METIIVKKRGRKIIGKTKRVPISFTVEEHVIAEFKEYCKTKGLSGSAYVQRQMEALIKK